MSVDVDVAADQLIVAGGPRKLLSCPEGDNGGTMTKRGRIVGFGSAGLLVIVGAVAAAAFSGTLGQVLALVLIGVGFVLATSLVFLEVGLSEDRERAREERRKERLKNGRRRPRLERMRGRPRKLR
jgi:hypothetical protein